MTSCFSSPLGLPLNHPRFNSSFSATRQPPSPELPPCCEKRRLPKTPCDELVRAPPPALGGDDRYKAFDNCRCLLERHPTDRWRCEASSRGLDDWRQYHLSHPLNVFPHLYQDRRYVPTESVRF